MQHECLCTLHSIQFHNTVVTVKKLHSAAHMSDKDTIHCRGRAENGVNLNLTYFQPMGVVRLLFYLQAGRGTWKLMLSSVLVAESQLQIPLLSPFLHCSCCVFTFLQSTCRVSDGQSPQRQGEQKQVVFYSISCWHFK